MSNTIRLAVGAALVSAMSASPATAAGLLFHDGFETCWVTAKTKPQFLESIRTSIDGTSACVPAQSGSEGLLIYTVCNTTNGCGVGVAGCPVSISAGTFSGDFVAGQFTAPGTAADIMVPITTNFFPACSVSLNTITLGYTLDYLMQTDGVDGVYSNDLMAPAVAITNQVLTNIDCDAGLFGLLGGNVAGAVAAAEASAAAAIEPALRANTLEQSVCPLTVP